MLSHALAAAMIGALTYPTTKIENVVDDYHGVKVSDPYRWLEQPATTPEVAAWVAAQNKVTESFLSKIPNRDVLGKELVRRINYERVGLPIMAGKNLISERNTGVQNQDVYFIQGPGEKKARVLLDPNKLSKDGTQAIAGTDVTEDGKIMAYAVSVGGSDWTEWRFRDTTTGKDLDDKITDCKFAVGFFDASGKTFYYLKFAKSADGRDLVDANLPGHLYAHKLGTSTAEDTLVYKTSKDSLYLWPGISPDRSTVFLYIQPAASINNRLSVLDLETKKVSDLFAAEDSQYNPVTATDDDVVIWTTRGAPNGRISRVPKGDPSKASVIVPERKYPIKSVAHLGGRLVVTYNRDAHSYVEVFGMDGKSQGELKLPGIGAMGGFSGKFNSNKGYYAFASFTDPTTIYTVDFSTKKQTTYKKPKMAMDTSKYESKQVFFKSKDGTRVPMTLVYKKGLKLNGQNPTIVYGYGGFGGGLTPWFSTSRTAWMDMGGIFVAANIRGGDEYGEAWHKAAIGAKRQNSFDDFIGAAEWLIANKYTSSKTLAIQGGSQGGYLVGVCMNQRPDLFGVAIPEVGVMDQLRFNQFTVGKAWESDYGSPQNPADFPHLLRFSPYHSLKDGVTYPATLVTTADRDDRVVPAHSFKFAARLQAAHKGTAPVLIRIDTSSGHGASNLTKSMESTRDIYAFCLQNMGKKIPGKF